MELLLLLIPLAAAPAATLHLVRRAWALVVAFRMIFTQQCRQRTQPKLQETEARVLRDLVRAGEDAERLLCQRHARSRGPREAAS